jgi:ribose transport system substrate-binding protein
MPSLMKPVRLRLAALLAAATLGGSALAADVELLPAGLLTPTTKEMTKANQYKKAGPWRIGVSFGGVGNTWIVQMIQEMKHAAAQDKSIGEFIFVEANWQAAKQVADVEDLLAKKVDAIIIGPISSATGAPLAAKAAKTGIPVVVFGAFGKSVESAVEIMGGGEVFGRQGGEYLRKELNGKGNLWAFRGVAGVEEEQLRYNGFKKAIEGSSLKITQEVFGDWNYAKSKQLCENLVLSGNSPDGIWFSGAEMTRACIDVFKESGKPLVPMTGEGNNGFLRVWKATGVKSVAPQFTPGLGAAVVRASAALLAGKPLYRSYFSSPPAITQTDLGKFFRDDLNDAYWMPSTLPDAKLKELFKR